MKYNSLIIKGLYRIPAIWRGLCVYTLFVIVQPINAQTDSTKTDSLFHNQPPHRTYHIREVEIKSTLNDINIKSGSTGMEIDVKQIKQLPKFIGESDPYKALQYMGGVSQAGEANSGLYVRGGNNDQNLILLNGTMIQNPTHVFGMFSVFNPDLIKQMRFVKTGIPAEYGGRLSSVVDMNMSNTIPAKTEVDGSVGLISSRISAQVPISPKLSIFASWRGSYIGSIILPILSKVGVDSTLTQNKYDFWDVNTGFLFNIAPRTKISGHFYKGKDDIKIGEIGKYNVDGNTTFWENTAAGIQLNHIFNDNWSMRHQINYSKFYIQSSLNWLNSSQKLHSQFQSINYKADFFYIIRNHQFKYGTEITYNKAVPHLVSADSVLPLNLNTEHNNIRSAQMSVYVRDEWTLEKWQFNIGMRASLYAQIGPYTDYSSDPEEIYSKGKIIKSYSNIEPRLFARYLITNHSSIKCSGTRHVQYLNQVPVLSLGIPTDLQVPASLYIKPQGSWHFSAGYFKNFQQNSWEFSMETYYKTLDNQLDLKNGFTSTFANGMFEKNILHGKGWTYGAEWKAQKNLGKLTGWISYNLAWSYRQFDGINDGAKFLSINDRRHNLSVVGLYQLNNRWSFSGVFVYATGSRINLPLSMYLIDNKSILEYGSYNAFVMPAYHRLDISATKRMKRWRGIESELNFSIYNLYNRANPFQVCYSLKTQSITMAYLLPIVPSVSWTFHL